MEVMNDVNTNTTNGVVKFNYNGNLISFAQGKDTMVNATEMAKVFDKLPANWLRNKQAKEFLGALSAMRKCEPTELVIVKNGGTDYGTWMHEDVALEFARWLSPEFAIWCNDRIKELMTTGVTTLDWWKKYNIPETYSDALRLAAEKTEQLELANEQIKTQETIIEEQENFIFRNKPALALGKAIEETGRNVDMGEMANILSQSGLNIGRNNLYELCRENGWVIKTGCRPSRRAVKSELFELQANQFVNDSGKVITAYKTVVTPKGQKFLINKLLNTDKIEEYRKQYGSQDGEQLWIGFHEA